MISDFLKYFNEQYIFNYSGNLYDDFISQLGGKNFGDGLFNSFSTSNIEKWTELINRAFPNFKGLFNLFGYDWLGRCFGIDIINNHVLMFDIGANEVLDIPCSLENFLNEEIPKYTDACLAKTFFDKWKKIGNKIEYGRCAGYVIPLFLGGNDDITNLEDSDMEVYWNIMTQILK